MKSKSDAVGVIQQTKEYDIFKRLKGNRPKHNAHVRELMDSFSKYPNLRQARPVIVNENMAIVDGQHSLDAAMFLEAPVFYVKVPGLTINETRVLNALNKPWELADYAVSFAETGKKEYVQFQELREEYPLPPSALLTYTTGREGRGKVGLDFRLGDYEPLPIMQIYSKLDKLSEFSKNFKEWHTQSFALAIHKLLSMDNYNHERMMKNLGDERLMHRSSRADYLRDLETVYNKSGGTTIRFL